MNVILMKRRSYWFQQRLDDLCRRCICEWFLFDFQLRIRSNHKPLYPRLVVNVFPIASSLFIFLFMGLSTDRSTLHCKVTKMLYEPNIFLYGPLLQLPEKCILLIEVRYLAVSLIRLTLCESFLYLFDHTRK